MASAHHECNERRHDRLVSEHVGEYVALEVVDAHERQTRGSGQPLGVCESDDECADQARAVGDSDSVQIAEAQRATQPELLAGALHRLVDDAHDRLGVLAARDLGHYAAESRVEVDLARDDVGDDPSLSRDDRGGRLVARALYREDQRFARRSRIAVQTAR